MKIEEIEIEKLKELKEKSMMLNDKRQKGKVTYKIWDIVVVAILDALADCNEWEEIADYAKDKKRYSKKCRKRDNLSLMIELRKELVLIYGTSSFFRKLYNLFIF